jgi:nitrogen regulatory protein P-II 2
MSLVPLKLITIVAEKFLKDQMVQKVLELGATGCSYHPTEGKGLREARHDDAFSENFQMKVVCPPEVADSILAYIAEHYFEHYAIVAWVSDVQVMRGKHFHKTPA